MENTIYDSLDLQEREIRVRVVAAKLVGTMTGLAETYYNNGQPTVALRYLNYIENALKDNLWNEIAEKWLNRTQELIATIEAEMNVINLQSDKNDTGRI